MTLEFSLSTATKTIPASDLEELCSWVQKLLGEIKNYFTEAEKNSWQPAFKRSYQFTLFKTRELAEAKCRSKRVMERRQIILEKAERELSIYHESYKELILEEYFS